ncbi:MAG: hypothetical protein DMF81_23740 [Acidobacteria bacterium]|nr:MAG: hypothetical protein DMF81_23740 [Acidobacteriota bacterium]
MDGRTRVVVVGAGIGGLAAAIALRRAGLDAVLFERADQIAEVGAGISLWANALRSLEPLGVADRAAVVERRAPRRDLDRAVASARGDRPLRDPAPGGAAGCADRSAGPPAPPPGRRVHGLPAGRRRGRGPVQGRHRRSG